MDGAQVGTGVYSNRLIRFINHLANRIGPNHPGKYVGTFAYGETRRPPDIYAADNVWVTFCYGGGNYMRKLTDPDDPTTLASHLSEAEINDLVREGVISKGMLPKVEGCLRAIKAGVRKAHIIDGRILHSLLLEIFTARGIGTEIVVK